MNGKYVGMVSLVGFFIVALTACGTSPDTSQLEGEQITVYYSPSCTCCGRYIEHLRDNGMKVKTVQTRTREFVRAEHGIPQRAASCHTSVIGDYAVEGHVPLESISRLTTNKPDINGISIPGMPKHAPGMRGPNGSNLKVIKISKQGQIDGVYQELTY
ncbi:MAG: DUF411 domain-containing protein [bacterium]